MVALKKIDAAARGVSSKDPLAAVFPALLYYVERRRNAWFANKSLQYFADCMHATLVSAQHAAEGHRAPGSILTIFEQPALVVQGEYGFAALTFIGDASPMSGMLTTRSYDYQILRLQLQSEDAISAQQIVRRLDGVAQRRHPNRTSIPAWFRGEGRLQASVVPARPLVGWQSESMGSDYLLGWSCIGPQKSGKPVVRLAKSLGRFCSTI